MTIQISDDALVKQLQAIATRENRSVEAVLQTLVDQYVDRMEAFIAMEGMFDDDITDLSTSACKRNLSD